MKEEVAGYVFKANSQLPTAQIYSDMKEKVAGYVFKADNKLPTTQT